jgi:hypothetical protein
MGCGKEMYGYVTPHPHRGGFNMAPCRACGEKSMCHTAIGKEKQCRSGKQTPAQPFLWLPRNRIHHIKRENAEKKLSSKQAQNNSKTSRIAFFDFLCFFGLKVYFNGFALRSFL